MRRRTIARMAVLALLVGAALTAGGPGQAGSAAIAARTARPAPSAWAGLSSPLALPTTLTRSWQGVDSAASAPAETAAAVGTQEFMQLVNGKFALYDRTNDAPLATGTLAQLLPGTPPATGHGGVLSAPQVLWDPGTGRFYFTFLDLDPPVGDPAHFTGDGRSYIVFGFSKDAAPTGPGDFCRYALDYGYREYDPPALPPVDALYPDSPKLGDTQGFVLLGVNVYDWVDGLYYGSDVDSVQKPPAGTACPDPGALLSEADYGIQDGNGNAMVSPAPAVQVDPSQTGWVVASKSLTGGGAATQLWLLKGTDSNAGPAFPLKASAVTVPSYAAPPPAPELGGDLLDTLDGQLGQAVAAVDPSRTGAPQVLWTQHTVAGGAGSQVRWYELNPAARTVLQSGAASSPTLYAFNGAIASDRVAGMAYGADMVLGFDTSSAADEPAVQWVAKEGSVGQTGFNLVQQSPAPAGGLGCEAGQCQWGGATAAADPGADTTRGTGQVWLTSPWASGTGDTVTANWKTQNFAVRVPLSPPVVSSFTPPSGPVGTPVTVSGSRFTGITGITVGGVNAFPPLAGSTATALKIAVPAGATTGTIAVTNDGGTAVSGSAFKVTPKITPWPIAPVQVGQLAHIPGTNLTNDDGTTPGVLKLGTLPVNAAAASGELTFTVPDVVSNKLTVTITTTAGPASYTTPSNLLIRPTIASVSAGPFTAGSTVTLTGNTFTGTTAVKFTGFAAPVSATSFKVVNPTTLTAVVPAAAVGGPVTVTNAGGSTPSAPLSIVPKTTAIAPASGPVGTLVTLTGTNFDSTATAMVGGVLLTDLQPVSAIQLKGRIGDGATTAGGTAIVTTAGGTSPSGPVFKVTPNVTSVNVSPVRVGDPVVATGTNLDEVTDAGLKIGAVPIPFTHDGPTSLDFNVPVAALTGPLTVTSAQGTTVTSTILHIRPTLDALPAPAEGPAGTAVRITGSTLTGTTAVKFVGFDGQESAPAVFKVTGGVLTVTVPPGAITGSILVTNAGGSTGTTSFTVDPKVGALTPSSAPVGGLLTIAGSGFDSGTTAIFTGNQTATQQAGTTATALKVLVPEDAQTGPIIVDTNSSSVNATTTSFKVAPRIDTIAPNPVAVNNPVTVTGLNLDDGTVTVKLGSLTVARTAHTQQQFTFNVPANAVSGKVTITTATGTATSQNVLQVTPTVAAMTPAQGAAGATVTITGSALGDASSVGFTGVGGGVPATFSKIAGGVKATVPATAVTGPITVHTGGGDATTASFLVLPKIASLSPASGPSASTVVTIKGSGLQAGATVTFTGGVSTTAAGGGATITAKVPPGAATGKVTVTNPADPGPPQATSASSFTVSLGITSFTPAFANSGDAVTITGTGFSASSKVFFGGDGTGPGTLPAVTGSTSYNPSTKQLTATPPDGANGRVTVKNGTVASSPVTWSPLDLRMLEVSSIAPDNGPTGTVATITGSGFKAGDVVTYNAAFTAPFSTAITDYQITDGGTHLTFTVPDGHFDTNGPTQITVAPPGDPAHAKATAFDVTLGIDSVAPPSGPIGNSLTIDGAFPDGHTYTGALNGTPFASLTVHGGGRLIANVPFGATSGKITITDTTLDPDVTVTSPSSFTITLRLTPYTGPTGTVVTATGLNFSNIDHVSIQGHDDGAGGSTVPATPSGNGSSLTFTIPADVPVYSPPNNGNVTIQPVTGPGGGPLGAASTSPFVVTADPAPYAGPH